MQSITSITEYKLFHWRGDRIGSERLCAEILSLNGYQRVDPQAPLGGPDGTKDILMRYGNQSFLAAVYFPPMPKGFASVKKKFKDDFAGVAKNGVNGMVFMTNQRLTPKNKATLRKLSAPIDTIIHDIEAIRVLLDNPRGYGIRLQHLGIPMTEEDQLSFVTHFMDMVDSLASRSTDYMKRIALFLEGSATPGQVYSTPLALTGAATRQPQGIKYPSGELPTGLLRSIFSTKTLDIDTVRLLHLLITSGDLGNIGRGELRSTKVWIGTPDSTADTAAFTPPEPDKIRALLGALLGQWREGFDKVRQAPRELVVRRLAWFYHRFLSIHPFLDANGRVANALIELLNWEVSGQWTPIRLLDSAVLFSALQEAHQGDLHLLEDLIERALTEKQIG